MLFYPFKAKLLFIAVLLGSQGALAQQTGGGKGSFGIPPIQVGGTGGGVDHWGGQGGGVGTTPSTYPVSQGAGGTGVDGDGGPNTGGAGGTIGFIINNPTDPSPVMGVTAATGTPGFGAANAGGGGGGAYVLINATTFTLTSSVTAMGAFIGNAGGSGSQGQRTFNVGSGGGGVGVVARGNELTIADGILIRGGNGGTAGDDGNVFLPNYGGGGGLGILLMSGTLNNGVGSTIEGGQGGLGRKEIPVRTVNGSPGSGLYMMGNTVLNNKGIILTGTKVAGDQQVGSAIIVSGDNTVITNAAKAEIGRVFLSSSPDSLQDPENFAAVEVTGNSNRIVNAGRIIGNPLTGPTSTSRSVVFNGNDNTLEIWGVQHMDGTAEAVGARNHLILGGDPDGSFNLAALGQRGAVIGPMQGYLGFADVTKNGTSTWTLRGVSIDTAPWTVSAGTLKLVDDASMALASSVTLSANLDIAGITGASTTMRNVSGDVNSRINLGDRVLVLQADSPRTFAGIASGAGGGVTIQQGTQIFTGDNDYTGVTTVASSATLQLGSGGGTGSIAGDAAVDGDLVFNRTSDLVYGGSISGGGGVHQTNSGKVTLTGDSSPFTGTTSIDPATFLQIGDGGNAGNLGGTVAIGGGLVFNRSDDWTLAGRMQGSGTIDKIGSGKLTLTTDSSAYTGLATIRSGTLAVDGALGGVIDVLGRLQGTGTVGSVINEAAGTVAPGNGGFDSLTVGGNFTGNGGRVEIVSVLGGDNSPTSRLIVNGDTSGSGNVQVTNRGGPGGLTVNGIEIITVGGQSGAAFSLVGDVVTGDGQKAVVAGAFAYTLNRGRTPETAGNWYLRSDKGDEPVPPGPPAPPVPPEPRYNPGAPLYEGAAQNMQVLSRLPTLQQRTGNRYWSGDANPVIVEGDGPGVVEGAPSALAGARTDANGIWGRVEGAHSRLRPAISTTRMQQTVNTVLLQAGVDGLFYEGESGKLIGGINGVYGRTKADITSEHGRGRVETDAWGLGATLTWYGESGFYLDGQAQANWFDNHYDSINALRPVATGRDATGYALSIETGQRFALSQSWALTPQLQLMWSSLDMGSFRDIWNTEVSLREGESLTGRAGASLDYWKGWYDGDGRVTRVNAYLIANVYQDFLRDASVRVADTIFMTQQDRTWGGVGLGSTYTWADNKYAVYGEGAVNTSLNNFADSYDLKGTVGFRVKW